MPTPRHVWKDSRGFFVGSLYPDIYPWYCECGAFRKGDFTILEPLKHCRVEKCPAGTFCTTTRDRPDHMTPKECPLLGALGLEYPKKEEQQSAHSL